MKLKGISLSRLALGTAKFGNSLSDSESFALIDVYREQGGNVLDTARVYGNSEETIGKYLASRKCRDKLIISTKGAHYDVKTKEKRVNRRAIFDDVEESLRLLGTDHADIYWLHRDDESVSVEEIMTALADLIKEGKILNIGVSNWTHERIAEANLFADSHKLPRIVASQIKHCAALTVYESDPTILSLNEKSRLFYANEKMPVFAYTSQARGLFSKLFENGENQVPEWIRREFLCEETLRRYSEIKTLAQELDRPVSQVALALLLCDRELELIPIIGGRTESQILDSLSATQIILTQNQINKVMKGQTV